MQNNNKKNSDAKIRANAKYNKKAYNNIAIRIKPSEAEFIDNLAKSLNLSKVQLILRSIHYIYNNNIDIVNYNIDTDTD